MSAGTVTAQVQRLLDVRRYPEARRLLGDALREAPDAAPLLYLAALTEYRAGEEAEARRWAAQALAREPGHPPTRELLVRLHLTQRRHAEAEREVLSLLHERPEDGRLYATYAQVMLESLHLEKAQALLQEALRLAPHDPYAQVLQVLLHVVRGDDRAALAQLRPLLAAAPDAEHVMGTLFTTLVAQHRHAEALRVGRELLRQSPGSTALVEALVELRLVTHWSTWPLRPLFRYGWAASGATWGLFVVLLLLVRPRAPRAAALLSALFLAWVVFSWVYPPLLRRWLRWRGF